MVIYEKENQKIHNATNDKLDMLMDMFVGDDAKKEKISRKRPRVGIAFAILVDPL